MVPNTLAYSWKTLKLFNPIFMTIMTNNSAQQQSLSLLAIVTPRVGVIYGAKHSSLLWENTKIV